MNEGYSVAAARYAEIGADAEHAMAALAGVPISIHCWQGDDVTGLENTGAALSGGIQATGNYPGRARSFAELTADLDQALRLIPGKKRLNLHASYAVFENGEHAERDELQPKHFRAWVEYAKTRGQLALEPLAVSARLKLQALPLHLLVPYAPPMPGVELVRARLDWEGELTLRQPAAGLQFGLRGDGRLADL